MLAQNGVELILTDGAIEFLTRSDMIRNLVPVR